MKRLDSIIVVDVESTCWDGKPPRGQQSEIIQIGICTVHVKKLVKIDSRSILIRPKNSEISQFCTELTGLKDEMFKANSIGYRNAMNILMNLYHSDMNPWASWGDYDRNMFNRMETLRHSKYPFGSRHINVKTLFAISYGLKREVGMEKAFEITGKTMQGRHHDGADDAWNIATILIHLLERTRYAKQDISKELQGPEV